MHLEGFRDYSAGLSLNSLSFISKVLTVLNKEGSNLNFLFQPEFLTTV